MPRTDDRPILTGVAHRALETLAVLIYAYDELGVSTQILRAGSIFVPWAPRAHWRGERVPITLGDGTGPFVWRTDAPPGLFLRWDDFFERCAPQDAPHAKAIPRLNEQPMACPFAELTAIRKRLRLASNTSGERAVIDACLAKLQALRAAHATAAEMQMGAEGFDNTESAARYATEKTRLLTEAQSVLAKAKDRKSVV